MKVNCPNLAKPLQDRCPPPPATDKEVTQPNLKDILGEDRVLRLPTLPIKLPPELDKKLKELKDPPCKCPNNFPKNVPPDFKWFPPAPVKLPPEWSDSNCPKDPKPPVLWDQLDPKFQNKQDDTRLA